MVGGYKGVDGGNEDCKDSDGSHCCVDFKLYSGLSVAMERRDSRNGEW